MMTNESSFDDNAYEVGIVGYNTKSELDATNKTPKEK